ncbi:MAG: RNA polymerase sigma factor [Caulobacteraceae bacterium]
MVETATEPASAHDLELVALAATGGRTAFGELARRHASAVRALLRRMGAEPALADDLAQDAFVIAFQQIGEFRGDGAFQAWVKRIAGRLYVRRLRREERFAKAMLAEGDSVGPEGRGIEARIDLDAALQGLPAVERVVIGLTFGAGLSHQEAAAALNAPLGTVKSHVKRGLTRLRRRLAGGGAIEDEEAAHA